MGIALVGATPSQIEERLDIYEKVRRNRTSAIQILSNVGQDQTHLVHDELALYLDEKDIPSKPFPMKYRPAADSLVENLAEASHYNFNHDAVGTAVEAMKEYDASFELPAGFFEKGDTP